MAREIAAAVIRLDQDRTLLAEMSATAPRSIVERYAHDRFVSAIRAVYDQAQAARRP